MADFRGLALQFVLTDDVARQREIAQETASALKTSDRSSNPVARWVESIQPWVSTSGEGGGMDFGEDGEATGDLVARSKAMSFLADTLEVVDNDFLKPTQVSLLIAYFGSMFKIDVKRGILPASKALNQVVHQKAFKPSQGDEIITSVCSLGDDFKNQVSETRAVVYQLIENLVSRADVANDLQYRHGATSGFITELLQLCQNERDPKCLMTWFGVLKAFLSEYDPSPEIVEEIFSIFSAYFPISLRTSQHPSGITKDDLKLALRECFSAHHRVAKLAIPYLIGRLDQGDAVTVNIKLDILSTLNACVANYDHTAQSIVPFVDKIWTSLKYEVRNGEVEDTIKGTLEVIRTLAQRLTGNDLRDFALTVQRDCLDDLSNPTYTAGSGKLLLCVHSAKPSAFAVMVTPTITHLKDNLRHSKSSDHTKNLLALLNSLLELRSILLADTELDPEDAQAFQSTEPAFASLYRESYMLLFHQATNPGAQKDIMAVGKEAIKGLGLLARQRSAHPGQSKKLMLDEKVVIEICTELSVFLASAHSAVYDQSEDLGGLESQACLALRGATVAYLPAFDTVLDVCFKPSSDASSNEELQLALQSLLPKVAFIGCSEVPQAEDKTRNFVLMLAFLLRRLQQALDAKSPAEIWVEYASGFQAAVRNFRDACESFAGRPILASLTTKELDALPDDTRFDREQWSRYVSQRFPDLPQIQNAGTQPSSDNGASSQDLNVPEGDPTEQLFADFVLLSLYVVKQLYRRATRVVGGGDGTGPSIDISNDFASQDSIAQKTEDQYLNLIADLGKFVVSQTHERHQRDLGLADEVVTLFRGGDIPGEDEAGTGDSKTAGDKLRDVMVRAPSSGALSNLESAGDPGKPLILPIGTFGRNRTIILSFGLFSPLRSRPSGAGASQSQSSDGAFAAWSNKQIPLQILIAGLLSRDLAEQPRSQATLNALLMSLANKFPVEKTDNALGLVQKQMESVVNQSASSTEIDLLTTQAQPVLAITAGILRRYKGSYLRPVLDAILLAPGAAGPLGPRLARATDILFHDHESLRKENGAVVNPLWRQRAYMEIVKPMLEKAWPAGPGPDSGAGSDAQVAAAAGYSVAVLAAVKSLSFDVYEADAEALVRLVLCLVRRLPPGPDVQAGMEVLVSVSESAPSRLEPFLKSVVESCLFVLEGAPSTGGDAAPSWMPRDLGASSASRSKDAARCRLLALALLQHVPKQHDHRHLRNAAPHVRRALGRASGDGVREVRRASLAARGAWADLN